MKSKIRKQLSSIFDVDAESMMSKQLYWNKHYMAREEFLAKTRKAGLVGWKYSDAVAEWDKENRLTGWKA